MEKKGVHAPKDPHERGARLYFLYKTDLEATPRVDGRASDELYLDFGRLKEKLRMMNAGIADNNALLDMFDTADGFRTVVAGVGISFDAAPASVMDVELLFYGKTSRFTSGLCAHAACPADGSETILWMDEQPFTGDEVNPGQFRVFFPQAGMTGKVTVVLYLKPGIDVPEPVMEKPVDFSNEAYQTMVARSLMSIGNNARLKKVLTKAASGQEIRLSFIGGSITQGAGAKPINTECYAYKAWQGLKEIVSPAVVRYTKAGIGGTPSELGMLRASRDLLADGMKPDIVVIEFAVNDEDDETQGRCYETLVRQSLAMPGNPAVVLLFSVFSNDWNLQNRLEPIGRYYALPMVSVLDAVSPQFGKSESEGGVMTKRQYFYDTFHPTNEGHTVMADCLIHLFETVRTMPADTEQSLPQGSLQGRTFEDVRLLSRGTATDFDDVEIQPGSFTGTDTDLESVERDEDSLPTPQFTDNWMHLSGNVPFSLTLTCKSLLLIAKDSGEDDFGTAEVVVDGKFCRTVDPHIAGWTHCNAMILFESDETQPHAITLRMRPGEEDKHFTILGFGVCR